MTRAVFFGTPETAVPSLDVLGELADVVLVVTRPDRPGGRSRRPQPSPVKRAASALGLPLAQPERPGEVAPAVRRLRPDVGVVVAYGQLLPAPLLGAARAGLVNVHFSLLPRWRGAAPVERAILAGDTHTGVTLMVVEEGLDTGPLLSRWETAIGAEEKAGELAARLAEAGAELLRETLPDHLAGRVEPQLQDEAGATQSPKITVDEAHLDTGKSAAEVMRAVRAFNPRPGAWGVAGGERLKVWRAALGPPTELAQGSIALFDRRLLLGTATGAVELVEVQPEGKRRMSGGAWARGGTRVPGRLL